MQLSPIRCYFPHHTPYKTWGTREIRFLTFSTARLRIPSPQRQQKLAEIVNSSFRMRSQVNADFTQVSIPEGSIASMTSILPTRNFSGVAAENMTLQPRAALQLTSIIPTTMTLGQSIVFLQGKF